jgi:hypothetical protein
LRNIATLKNDLPAFFWTTIYIFWKNVGAEMDAPAAWNCQSKPSRSWSLLKRAPLAKKECVMDWNRIEGNWKQFKGRARRFVINGRPQQVVEGKVHKHYPDHSRGLVLELRCGAGRRGADSALRQGKR